MPVTRPQTYTQKTKDALAYFLGGAQAAMLCSVRGAGRSAGKEEILAAYLMLFDAITPIIEDIHDRPRRESSLPPTGTPEQYWPNHPAKPDPQPPSLSNK